MNRLYTSYIVFMLLTVLGVAEHATGVALWIVQNVGGWEAIIFPEIPKCEVKNPHFIPGIALIILTMIHVPPNWSWMVEATNIVSGKSLQQR